MSTFLFPVFDYIAKNRWAQIVLTGGLVLLALRTKKEIDEARGERRGRAKVKEAVEKQERKLEERVDEVGTRTERAVDDDDGLREYARGDRNNRLRGVRNPEAD